MVKAISQGINVVIMGIPNAGKSSLFNAMVGQNRTIVSNIQGTTRDAVESKITINQYPINLIDTAGYFNANDEINIASINQTMEYANNADIIIYLDQKNPINSFKRLKRSRNYFFYD